MSPILVRPVREQLEHDRVIRLLQAKSKRKFDADINPGSEQNAPVTSGATAVYPDVVLHSLERGRRLLAVVEVETGESVNHLEALAQWAPFARLRVPFHLYVPANMIDVARRLCEDNGIKVSEIWSYHGIGDQVRFTLVHRSRETVTAAQPRAAAAARGSSRPSPRPSGSRTAQPARRRPKPGAPKRKTASKPARNVSKKAAPPRKRR